MHMCMFTIKLIAPINQEQPLEVDQHQAVPATTTPNTQQQSQALALEPLTSLISPRQLKPGDIEEYL